MDFQKTGLPDRDIFRSSFHAGFRRYVLQFQGNEQQAHAQYLRGPAAMARLIFERGGEFRQIASAACLAGPAAFSAYPSAGLNRRIIEFAYEIRDADNRGYHELSYDARLFLQVSAIALLEQLADGKAGETADMPHERRGAYTQALDLYSQMRGGQDTYRLDTRFEIAAMKASTMLDEGQHLWAPRRAASFNAL